MEEIHGYKAFNKDKTNRYGRLFIDGETYQINEMPSFGNKGVGFHFCKRLEDTLRYFPAMKEEIEMFRFAYGENEKIQNTISYYQEGKKDVFHDAFQKQLKGK